MKIDGKYEWTLESTMNTNVPESVSLRYTVPLDLDSSISIFNDKRRWSMSKVKRPKSNTSF